MKACEAELLVTASDISQGDYWVAEAEKVCGFIAFEVDSEADVGVVAGLFIDPAWQGQGIGTMLWQKVKQRAQSNNIKTIQLDADPAAVPFYESMGFKVVRQVPSGSIEGRFIPQMETEFD